MARRVCGNAALLWPADERKSTLGLLWRPLCTQGPTYILTETTFLNPPHTHTPLPSPLLPSALNISRVQWEDVHTALLWDDNGRMEVASIVHFKLFLKKLWWCDDLRPEEGSLEYDADYRCSRKLPERSSSSSTLSLLCNHPNICLRQNIETSPWLPSECIFSKIKIPFLIQCRPPLLNSVTKLLIKICLLM